MLKLLKAELEIAKERRDSYYTDNIINSRQDFFDKSACPILALVFRIILHTLRLADYQVVKTLLKTNYGQYMKKT